MGSYNVEVKARLAEDSPSVRVRGMIEVTPDAVIQHKSPP
jgi:hypothetical protein